MLWCVLLWGWLCVVVVLCVVVLCLCCLLVVFICLRAICCWCVCCLCLVVFVFVVLAIVRAWRPPRGSGVQYVLLFLGKPSSLNERFITCPQIAVARQYELQQGRLPADRTQDQRNDLIGISPNHQDTNVMHHQTKNGTKRLNTN